MSRRWTFFAVALALGVALDFWSKRWALGSLQQGESTVAWGGLLKLTLSFNQGAAFGLNLGGASRPLFIVFTLIVLVWLLVVYHRPQTVGRGRALGVALVAAGAFGNLIDRVFWSRGVIDFIGPYDLGFMTWPIFNLADCYVVVGIAALLLSLRHGSMLGEMSSTLDAEG